ncbi:MAG: hypothetical protein HOB79_11695 [Rhodospirillaceae bacterium]|jgi:hypothetical protein|nr:hypothetical protein [Rhodospirillaceae bacterium]MBT7768728.1 hypothetical protein [Rhodospirillales bacterium]MBT4701721.1 hypothetical protein [Rhodospirillaceae bacterium]MBT5034776.1 hypothetical protein [Rhodospirillaceae bacterium]MBT6218343.1 hypothetical protein [Rhodospirillaceae bacterium]
MEWFSDWRFWAVVLGQTVALVALLLRLQRFATCVRIKVEEHDQMLSRDKVVEWVQDRTRQTEQIKRNTEVIDELRLKDRDIGDTLRRVWEGIESNNVKIAELKRNGRGSAA